MNNQQRTIKLRLILQMLLVIVVAPFLPLLIAGRWGWWEAWAYAIISIAGFVISRVLAARRHPDLIAERARHMQQANIKPWDRRLTVWLMLGGILVVLVAGLNERFGWSSAFGWPVTALSLVMIVVGYVLSSYALIENRFFSSTVRIQAERGHHVVSSGPLPLGAASRLCRGTTGLPGHAAPAGCTVGLCADDVRHGAHDHPHRVGGSDLAGGAGRLS